MPGRPIEVRGEPYAIAVTPDGKTVYVANTFGTTPLAIAVTPKGEAAYVAGRPSRRRPEHGDADRDGDQHAGGSRSRSGAGRGRSRSRRIAGPPTSSISIRIQ